ncbi:hypothetical protein [Pseudomonas luteola]|uniref:hypothetical protein n=1 Tax=Pseudomonas luteola TaxID=47886 RepID=UPI003CC777CB
MAATSSTASPQTWLHHAAGLEAKLPEDLVSDLFEEVQGDYTGVIAYYRDKATGKEIAATAGDQTKPKRLHYLYANKHTAKHAVEREWRKVNEYKAD